MSRYLVLIYTKSISLMLVLGSVTPLTFAEAVTDSSWGKTPQTLRGDFTIPETLGKRSGGNLFHSFEKFNINRGESATFTTTTPTIANVIARVSGRESSSINGALSLHAPDGGQPNFFFINPNGVTFGPGAEINVPGAFHVSTANRLEFADGTKFIAGKGPDNTLSVAAPEAFGFLGGEQSAAAVRFLDISSGDDFLDRLSPPDDAPPNALAQMKLLVISEAFDVLAGKVDILNSDISLGGLESMRIIATGASTARINTKTSSPMDFSGRINITNSLITTSGNAVDIILSGNSISLDSAYVSTENLTGEPGNGGTISLYSSGSISLANHAHISSRTTGSGNAGNIILRANSISLDDARISSDSEDWDDGLAATGNAGQISLDASGSISLSNSTYISSDTFGPSHTGNITLRANSIDLDDARVSSNSWYEDHTLAATNNAGQISLHASGSISLANGAYVTSDTYGSSHAGNIALRANSINLDNATISSNSLYEDDALATTGNAGQISIDASGSISLANFAGISSDTFGSGNAGNITLRANSINLDAGAISSDSRTTGNAGQINLDASGSISLDNLARISSNAYGSGPAGDITLNGNSINLDDSIISNNRRQEKAIANGTTISVNHPLGNGGTISLYSSGSISLANGAHISSDTYGSSHAGSITLKGNSISLDDATISSNGNYWYDPPAATGNAGLIFLDSPGDILLSNRSSISSRTFSSGAAGAVNITAGGLCIAGSKSGIFSSSEASSSGKTGNVTINVNKHLTVTDGASINIENHATVLDAELVTPGQLSISATDINVNSGASISAASKDNVKASNISINASNTFQVINASVMTTAKDNSGGSITVNTGQMIRLTNGRITTSVERNGDGGNIRVNTPMLLMEQGYIQANTSAKDGSGGKVFIDTKGLIASHGALSIGELSPIQLVPGLRLNVIQAAAPEGISGEITLVTPQTDVAGQLAELEQPNVDADAFSRNICRIGAGSSLTQAKRGSFSHSPLRVLRPLVQTPSADRKNFSSSSSDSPVY